MSYGRIVLGGVLAGAQRWSIGLNLDVSNTTTPLPSQMQTFAEAVRALFDADVWSGTPAYKAMVGTASNFDVCHAYFAPVGAPPPPFYVSGDSTGAAVAGTGARSFPAQTALVVTLLTAASGRSARGRSYLPLGIGSFTTGTSNLSASFAALATGFAAFIAAVNGSSMGGNTVSCVIRSNTGHFGGPLPITRVKIDNVADTQRRRRDKITATSVYAATV